MTSPTSQRVLDALARMPELSRWFSAQTKPLTIADPVPFHLWTLVRALKANEAIRCRTWTEPLNLLIESNATALESILQTDELANTLGYSLTDIYTPLAESAILSGEGKRAFTVLQKLADSSGLAAFRFLAAWTAFNDDELAVCIAECEKTTEPFAPIYTLLGQALLESGKTHDAIDALKVATKIDTTDPLPRVQLIKAYLVLDIPTEAMRLIDECRKILGPNIEIECLAAMSIMASPNSKPEFVERTLVQLGKHLQQEPGDFEAFSLAMDVAMKLARKDWGQSFVNMLEIEGELNIGSVMSRLPGLLKQLNELRWYDAAKVLLDKTIVVTRSQSQGISFTQ